MKIFKQEPKSLEGLSYWQLVWRNFKKKKSATFSLAVIFFFFFIAVFAPFLANEKPLALYTQYKEFYRYYFESWSNVEKQFRYALTHREELLEEQKEAQIQFNNLKEKVYALSQTRDSLETEYQEIKSTVENLEARIQKIQGEQEEGEKLSSEIVSEMDSLEKEKAGLEEKRKKLGARQLSIREEKVKSESEKEHWNLRLLELNNQLDEEKWAHLILNSLKKMEFSASGSLKESIESFREEYQAVVSEEDRGQKALGLEGLRGKVEERLSRSLGEGDLSYRWTFPAVESLSYRDIFFMSGFLFFLLLPIIWKVFRRRVGFGYVGIGFWVLIFFILLGGREILSSGQNVPTNYKKWIVEEFQGSGGDSDHWVLLAWVPYGLNENSVEERYQKPSIFGWGKAREGGKEGEIEKRSRHLLGTDATGRDVLSRMIWGARVSLSVGFVAVSIYVLIGILIGGLAGYFVGKVDMVISRIIEIVICFPSFFLILTIIAFVGNSIFNIMVVIGLTSWPGVARLVRGEFLKLRTLDFVTAARALGVSTWRIVLRHILPNALTPVLVSVSFGIASAMLVEAGLSFLGFGVQEPFPSWGQMISTGQSDVLNYWWLSLIPGLAIFICVTTYNLVGDALREAIDPKLKEIA